MSLINQVLNDLEKRGVNGPLLETTVRAVPAQRNLKLWTYVIVGVVSLSAVGAILLVLQRQAPIPPPVIAEAMLPMEKDVSQIVAASPVLTVAVLHQQIMAASQPLDVSQVAVALQPEETKKDVIAHSSDAELDVSHAPISVHDKPLVELVASVAKVESPPATANKATANMRVEPAATINKQMKRVSPQQQAENEFRKANLLAQHGRLKEAVAGFETALRLDPLHATAREALVAVLLESKRNAEAENVLQEGLKQNPKQTHFAMLLARLQVERSAVPLALETLEQTLPYANNQADYQAFMAALLQRQNRHEEAVTHYQIALQSSPNAGVWQMGLGISLQAMKRKEEALNAYRRAIETRRLTPELQAFVEQRMNEIKL